MRCASRSITQTLPSQSTAPECCQSELIFLPFSSWSAPASTSLPAVSKTITGLGPRLKT